LTRIWRGPLARLTFSALTVTTVVGVGVIVAALAASPTASAATARAAPAVVGIGEQSPAIFGNPHWAALRSRDVRYIAPWDALMGLRWQREEVDGYMNAARGSPARASSSRSATRGSTSAVARCRRRGCSGASSSSSTAATPA